MIRLQTLMEFFFSRAIGAGLFEKARARTRWRQILGKPLFPGAARKIPTHREAEVVVVGIGIAGLALIRHLKHLGFSKITVIARDERFGGKCLHYGCMAAEFFSSKAGLSPEVGQARFQEIKEGLRSALESQFQSAQVRFIKGEVKAVEGKEVILKDGEKMPFERLVLATGNQVRVPSELGNSLTAESFWEMTPSGNLLVVSDGNLSALAYAQLASQWGARVTLAFQGEIPFKHLPSFSYVVNCLRENGIVVRENVNFNHRTEKSIHWSTADETGTCSFDHLFYVGTPEIQVPKIDGKKADSFDIDFRTGALSFRPDIFLIGDAAGLLQASEAELQARLLALSWVEDTTVEVRNFHKVPFRLHTNPPLAFVGHPLTFLRKDWKWIDFNRLGWHAIRPQTGRLWYLYNPDTDHVEAIHICHPDSPQLITVAASLVEMPVSDARWYASSVHPGSAEIFKLLVEDVDRAKGTAPQRKLEVPSSWSTPVPVTVPNPRTETGSELLDALLKPEEKRLGVLDSNPNQYFAVLLALKCLTSGNLESSRKPVLLQNPDGRMYVTDSVKDFSYKTDPKIGTLVASVGQQSVVVQYEPRRELT